MLEIPPIGGSYALAGWLYKPVNLTIGRFGRIDFRSGAYVYVGSAFGPGGLQARISRHMRREKRMHWHIDWLAPHLEWQYAWMAAGSSPLECLWSRALASCGGLTAASPGFGSTDCRAGCEAHLYWLESGLDVDIITQCFSAVTRMAGMELLQYPVSAEDMG